MNIRSVLAVGLGLTVMVVAPSGSTPRPDAVQLVESGRATATCNDIALIGVDGFRSGGGEAFGATLNAFVKAYVRRAATAGHGVDLQHVRGTFASARDLVGRAPASSRADRAVTRGRAARWLNDPSSLVSELSHSLAARVAKCPDQIVVLAGYAQGASVVHRLLGRVVGTPLSAHVAGAVLVSDPDRGVATAADILGNPAAPRSGQGVVNRLVKAVADVPPPGLDISVTSVCTRGDLVCDLRGSTVRNALAIQHSYATGAGRLQVAHASSQLWQRTQAWPVPVPGQDIQVAPGDPLSLQLLVSVGAGYADTVVFEDAQGLPPGVTLSSTGLLSGSLALPGSWIVSYRVRNTSPVTSSLPGSVTITSSLATASVSAGGQSTCEVRGDATAWCWGDNTFGQLGDGTNVDSVDPAQVGTAEDWASISTSGNHTCAIKQDATLWCWGVNNRGQLGLGGGIQRWNPQQVGQADAWQGVSVGWMHTCAVKLSGSLWCWGGEDHGQLGLGGGGDRLAPARVGSDDNWATVSVGGWHTCALRNSGSAWCWGRNDLGQLGDGTTVGRARPGAVNSQTSWTSIDATWSSTCALAADQSVSCWGMNDQGQLGDGTRVLRLNPQLVLGGHTWVDLSVGDAQACAVDINAAAWCWGSNRYGQLGTGTTTSEVKPARVRGGFEWHSIDAGWMHVCGVASEPSSQCWGNNEQGQLASGDRKDRSLPPGAQSRRQVPAPPRGLDSSVVVTTFNVLGSQHTVPGGGTPTYAPGRIRVEWARNLLNAEGSDIVGFQELQRDQLLQLQKAFGDSYEFYPGQQEGPRALWMSMMWDSSQWEMTGYENLEIPVIGKTRPNPMVRLRSLATGKEIWVINVHNSSKTTPEREKERDRATAMEIAAIKARRNDNVPVLFLGDMNEHKEAFCKITGHTDLAAVTGGSRTATTCVAPRVMRVDWIFASPEFKIRSASMESSGRVARITDHSVLTAQLSLP